MEDKDKKRKRERLASEKKRALVASLKIERGCYDCGYNENSAALEFDHFQNNGVPFTGKQRTVASLMYASIEKILSEIEKCQVVCANCHAIRTKKRRITRM